MQKTRLGLVLVAVLFAVTLTGCGGAEQAQKENEKAQEAEREEESEKLREAEEKHQQKQETPDYDIGDTHYSQISKNGSSITVHSYTTPVFSTNQFSQPLGPRRFSFL